MINKCKLQLENCYLFTFLGTFLFLTDQHDQKNRYSQDKPTEKNVYLCQLDK